MHVGATRPSGAALVELLRGQFAPLYGYWSATARNPSVRGCTTVPPGSVPNAMLRPRRPVSQARSGAWTRRH